MQHANMRQYKSARETCGVEFFMCCWRLMYVFIFLIMVTEWPPIGKMAAHSACGVFYGIST